MRGSGFLWLPLQGRSQFFVIGGNPEQKFPGSSVLHIRGYRAQFLRAIQVEFDCRRVVAGQLAPSRPRRGFRGVKHKAQVAVGI